MRKVIEVGDAIKARREELGMTQAKLARLLEVDVAQLSRWERGVYSPSLNIFRDIAKALKTTLTKMLGD